METSSTGSVRVICSAITASVYNERPRHSLRTCRRTWPARALPRARAPPPGSGAPGECLRYSLTFGDCWHSMIYVDVAGCLYNDCLTTTSCNHEHTNLSKLPYPLLTLRKTKMRSLFALASRAGNYFLTDLITNRTIYTYTHLTDNIMCIVAGNFRSFPSKRASRLASRPVGRRPCVGEWAQAGATGAWAKLRQLTSPLSRDS